MDTRHWVRDKDKVKACFKQMPDKSLVATKTLYMYVPVRWNTHYLASIGSENYVVGIVATRTEDNFYSVSRICAMWRIEPTATTRVFFGEDEYYEFRFDPGAKLLATMYLVKNDILVYRIFDEINAKAHVPWYLDYTDVTHLYDSALKYAGTGVGENRAVMEILASISARDSEDRSLEFRKVVNTEADLKKRPVYVKYADVMYTASNTLNKLAGNHFQRGLVSALNNPSDRAEKIEELLK